jgi:hypothetical protein
MKARQDGLVNQANAEAFVSYLKTEVLPGRKAKSGPIGAAFAARLGVPKIGSETVRAWRRIALNVLKEPICADSGGYSYGRRREDLRASIDYLTKKARAIEEDIRSLKALDEDYDRMENGLFAGRAAS